MPVGEAVFFRSFFAIPVILGWLIARGELRTGLKVKSKMGHFWRGQDYWDGLHCVGFQTVFARSA